MQCSLFKFSFTLNSVLLFWRQSFEFLLSISENVLHSVPVVLVNITLLDVLQLLMIYLEP
jgi:hypothetical protein